MDSADGFATAREAELVAEAASWDTSELRIADVSDVPVIDVRRYLTTGDLEELDRLGDEVRFVGENVGFHFLVGHGIPTATTEAAFDAARAFLTLPEDRKRQIEIDHPRAVARGVGWLRVGERRLPRRAKGNLNEAILFKQDRDLELLDNPWPDEQAVPGFKSAVVDYASEIERVAMSLLPVYARALDLPADYFEPAFEAPFYRLRMSRYPPVVEPEPDEYGIAPHVDTTFFTLLAQTAPGLVIYSEQRRCWLQVPVVPGALVVNTGELLKQWSNDRFVSVKHFVPTNVDASDRYSVPFFFNATADYPMACLPTCHGPGNPPRYPTISYLESQAGAQGE